MSSSTRPGQRVYKKLRIMKARYKLEGNGAASDDGSEDESGLLGGNNASSAHPTASFQRHAHNSRPVSPSSSSAESSSPTVARPSKKQRTNGQPSVPDMELNLTVPLPVLRGFAPQTPPRARLPTSRPVGPQSSPRDLSALFAAVSPANSPHRGSQGGTNGSPGSGERPRNRPMLTKAQSMGGVASPSRSGRADGIQDGEESPFPVPRSVLAPSTPSRSLRPTQSMPESPFSKWTNPAGSELNLLVPAHESPNSERSGGAKRTYGRSRTMLSAEGLGDGNPPSSGPVDSRYEAPTKESYAHLRKRYEVDNSVVEGEGSGIGNLMAAFLSAPPPQPISDMRSKGENRRFMDELGYLIDPITDPSSSIALKRNSCIEVLDNMHDADWLAKMRICGQTERLWEILVEARGDSDEIIDAACLLFVAILIHSGAGIENMIQSHRTGCFRTVLHCLQVRDGALDQPSRVKAKGAASRLRNIAHKLETHGGSNFSTRRIASFILGLICAEAQWDIVEEVVLVEKAFLKVLRSYVWEVQRLSKRFDWYEKGLELLPTGHSVSLEHIEQCLRIISFLLLRSLQFRNALAIDHVDAEEDLLQGLIAVMVLYLEEGNGKQEKLAASCVIETLQILANVCNISDEWASRLAATPGALTAMSRIMLRTTSLHTTLSSPDEMLEDTQTSQRVPKVHEDEEAPPKHPGMAPEEIFCLVLAILAKSVVASEAAPSELSNLKVDPTCVGTGPCLRNCRCPDAQPFGHLLVTSYLEQLDHPNELEAGIMTGYLALLLVKLLNVGVAAAENILPRLPGTTRRQKLENLMTSLLELRGLESAVQRKLQDLNSSAQMAEAGADGSEYLEGTTDKRSINGTGMLQETIDELQNLLTT